MYDDIHFALPRSQLGLQQGSSKTKRIRLSEAVNKWSNKASSFLPEPISIILLLPNDQRLSLYIFLIVYIRPYIARKNASTKGIWAQFRGIS